MGCLKERIKALEARRKGDAVYVMAQTPEGLQTEITIEEWYQNRHTLKFLKFTRGFDPTYGDVALLLKAIDEEANEFVEQTEEG